MTPAIEKLFKGYTVKEIEEILFKSALKTKKEIKKHYVHITKSAAETEKRILTV